MTTREQLPELLLVGVGGRRQGGGHVHRLGGVVQAEKLLPFLLHRRQSLCWMENGRKKWRKFKRAHLKRVAANI